MCYCLYIATENPQTEIEWKEGETFLSIHKPSDEEPWGIRPKMKNPFIYHLGASSGCSCDFGWSPISVHLEENTAKKSPQMLIEFIKELTKSTEVELFCCWYGDWENPILESITIDIETISLEKNYFGLEEGRYIQFLKI